MQKSNLIILVFALMLVAQNVSASALVGPSCFVTAEVVEISSEMRQLDSGREYESNYLNLKVLSIDKGTNCPVQENQIFKAIDNHPGTFNKGDRIKAGIESASNMGPSGVVSFLQWSDLTYENGNEIPSKYNNAIIDHLQSDSEPIAIGTHNDIKEGNDVLQDDNQDATINYFYFIIPILIIVGFLLYWFLRKRSAP